MTTRIQASSQYPGKFDVIVVESAEFKLVVLHHVAYATAKLLEQSLVERRKVSRVAAR